MVFSNKNGQALVIGIVAIVLVAVAIIALSGDEPNSSEETQNPQDQTGEQGNVEGDNSNVTDEVIATHTVNMTANGFSPETLTIDQGDTVRFVNVGNEPVWPAVNEHPSHTQYDGTSESQHCSNDSPVDNSTFDACRGVPSGESYEFTFEKIGEWSYHDHISWRNEGTITVE